MAYRSRERVRKILTHQEADRVPYCAIHDPPVRHLVEAMVVPPDHRAFCLEGDFAFVYIEPEADMERLRPYLGDLPVDTEVSYWGIGEQPQTTEAGWHAGHRMFHPLANVDTLQELKEYPFPDLASSGADEGLEQQVRRFKEDGYTVLGQMSQTILETAYNMRGIPQLMVDFYERPRYVEFLFNEIAKQRFFQAQRFAEASVDILRIGDDIATQRGLMVSPALYQEWIKPLHAAVIAQARHIRPSIPVKYHSDGQLTDLLPDLIDIGVNIINPVQPECMDLLEIKHTFGKELVLWGCMPVQSVFAHGSADDVQSYLEFLMDEIAVNGGLVVKFTNWLSTDRSLANLRIFFETFYELGRY
jgi:uroporphyrinogen decarboxylase